MPESIVMGAIVIVGAGLAALGVLAWLQLDEYRLARRRSRPDEVYSPERYQPMARLLAGEDLDFLRRNTSCPKVAVRWERSQHRIIRLYLKELAADFHRLHAKARALVAESPEQYAVLVPVLFRQQFAFWRTLAMIELRLALGGMNMTQASVGELVGAIEAMQREISRAAASAA
jgi:hypothetical protein